MGPALVTDGDSDQTASFITSRQCVEAAGRKQIMIASGIG